MQLFLYLTCPNKSVFLCTTDSLWTFAVKKLNKKEKMLLCFQNCSDLVWEKLFYLVIEKMFWNSRLKAEYLQNFEITKTICSNSESSKQFLVSECFFNLFLEVSQIQKFRTIRIQIGNKLETNHTMGLRNIQEKSENTIVIGFKDNSSFVVYILPINYWVGYLPNNNKCGNYVLVWRVEFNDELSWLFINKIQSFLSYLKNMVKSFSKLLVFPFS